MNKDVNILLINLPISTWYKKMFAENNSMPPLGMLYVGTALEKEGFNVTALDLAVENFDTEELKRRIISASPQIIGLSTYNEAWYAHIQLCKLIKKIDSNIKIFAGGAFATFCFESILNESMTDYVVAGEGEFSTTGLCKAIVNEEDVSQIPGIIWKNCDNEIIQNVANSRIQDLDKIPWPNRSLLDLTKYQMPYTISTARGCPGQCIFCSSKSFWGHCVIMRSAESVFEEIMYLNKKYKANLFYVADDTFTSSRKRAMDVCNMLINSGIKFTWACESRADIVDDELISTLKKAGCWKIQFGLESAENSILKSLKKKVTVEQIENAIKIAYKHHMHITASFIVGHAVNGKYFPAKNRNYFPAVSGK